MQHLRDRIAWDVAAVEKLAAVSPNEARALIKALEAEGLVERNQGIEGGGWSITQRGHSFGSATAAKPITRQTAERTLAEFAYHSQKLYYTHFSRRPCPTRFPVIETKEGFE
jgi:DNA-binding IclR family transcriptional regulator